MAESETGASPEPETGPGGTAREPAAPPSRHRPPVTIDLAATPVDSVDTPPSAPPPDVDLAEAPAPESPQPEYEAYQPSPPDTAERSRFALPEGIALAPLVIAAVAGAIVALVVGFGLEATGVLPTPAAKNAKAALALAEKLEGDIAATQAGEGRSATEMQAISARLAGVESMTRDLLTTTEQLRGLDGSTAANEALLNQLAAQLSEMRASMKDLNTAGMASPEVAEQVASLTTRLDEMSARLTQLSDNPPVDRRIAAAARAMAFAGLRAAADKGESFTDALTMLRVLGVETAILAPLDAAKDGVPSRAALAGRFDKVASNILAASEAAEPDTNIFQRLLKMAGAFVTIRPAGPIVGTTAAAIVSRMRADVTAGDFAAAFSEREGLPDAGKTASDGWARDVAARVALDKAVASLADAIETASAGQ